MTKIIRPDKVFWPLVKSAYITYVDGINMLFPNSTTEYMDHSHKSNDGTYVWKVWNKNNELIFEIFRDGSYYAGTSKFKIDKMILSDGIELTSHWEIMGFMLENGMAANETDIPDQTPTVSFWNFVEYDEDIERRTGTEMYPVKLYVIKKDIKKPKDGKPVLVLVQGQAIPYVGYCKTWSLGTFWVIPGGVAYQEIDGPPFKVTHWYDCLPDEFSYKHLLTL